MSRRVEEIESTRKELREELKDSELKGNDTELDAKDTNVFVSMSDLKKLAVNIDCVEFNRNIKSLPKISGGAIYSAHKRLADALLRTCWYIHNDECRCGNCGYNSKVATPFCPMCGDNALARDKDTKRLIVDFAEIESDAEWEEMLDTLEDEENFSIQYKDMTTYDNVIE